MITSDSLKRGWQAIALELYKQGGSDAEVMAKLGVSKTIFDNMLANEDDEMFSQIIINGRTVALAWWLEAGRINLENKAFNYSGWLANMKGRFGWADKTEVKQDTLTTIMNMSPEELDAQLSGLIQKHRKNTIVPISKEGGA